MRIEDLIKKAYKAKKLVEKATSEYNSYRSDIQKYFDSDGVSSVNKIHADNIVATKVERASITYFVDKLREKISKKAFKQVTRREYKIANIEEFIELLKQHGVKQSQFKRYIDVNIVVDKAKVQQLYEIGDITKDQLKGCYEATITKYIDLKETKEKGDD